jgi:hypothetical protein
VCCYLSRNYTGMKPMRIFVTCVSPVGRARLFTMLLPSHQLLGWSSFNRLTWVFISLLLTTSLSLSLLHQHTLPTMTSMQDSLDLSDTTMQGVAASETHQPSENAPPCCTDVNKCVFRLCCYYAVTATSLVLPTVSSCYLSRELRLESHFFSVPYPPPKL